MRIAWNRLTMPLDLDYNTASMNCTEMRAGFMKALVEAGHEITIYAPMSKASTDVWKAYQNKMYERPNGDNWVDNTWIKHIKYEPLGFPSGNCDVMVCETAATNWMFYNSLTKQPQMRRCAEIMDKFKGTVFMWQTDPDLSFPYYKMTKAKRDWNHKKNPYKPDKTTTGVKNLEDYGWATYDEIFKDKKHVVITFSTDVEKVKKEFCGSRDRYSYFVDKGLIEIIGAVTPFDPAYVEKVDFNVEPEFDVIYTGYPRGRENRFKPFFTEAVGGKIKSAVTGPWSKKKNIPEGLLPESTTDIGFLKNFCELPHCTNRSKALLHLGVPKARKFGWTTSRIIEAVYSGVVVYYDAELKCYDDILGKEFALHSSEEAKKVWRDVSKMKNKERSKLWRTQWKRYKKYTWKRYVTKFEGWIEKYS